MTYNVSSYVAILDILYFRCRVDPERVVTQGNRDNADNL